jgi:hypothetical protein
VSISTIRRLCEGIKETNPNLLKYEELPTGHRKIYIPIEYMDEHFSKTTIQNNYSSNNHNEQLTKTLERVIKMLNNELDIKNTHVSELLKRQHESNVIIKTLQDSKTLSIEDVKPETKKKWWRK